MDAKTSRDRLVRFALLAAFAAAVVCVVLQSKLVAELGEMQTPSKSLVDLKMKFNGAASCNSPSCHGGAVASAAPARPGNEFRVWTNKDKHSKSYKTLTTDESTKIAKAFGLATPATQAEECLSCHALSVPAELQGSKYDIKEGVSCNSCHGPSDKWLTVHKQPGWIDQQRKAIPDHQKLLETYGIYDTQPVAARADRCTSCHLAMDAKLVAAGHPQPVFELAYFSKIEPRHWHDPANTPTSLFTVKLWAAGQASCLSAALYQLADRSEAKADTKSALDQMHGHYLMYKEAMGIVDAGKAAAIDKEISSITDASDPTAVRAAAKEIGATAEDISKHTFTAEESSTMLKNILGSDEPGKVDSNAQLQQAEAIYDLYTAAVPGGPAATAVSALVPTGMPSGPLDAGYAAKLAAARAAIK